MKKFLIATILIIPLLVIIALSATGSIISASVSVNVENLIFLNSNDEEMDFSKTYTMDLIGGFIDVIIIAIPTITYNSEVNYRLTEDSKGEVTLQKIEGNKYRITPIEDKPGEVGLIVFAQNNINASRVINIYITTDRLKDLSIVTPEHQTAITHLSITEKTRLFTNCYPVEAIGNNNISWSSSNSDILSIDNNGLISIKSKGVATVTAQVHDKEGTLHSTSISVDTQSAYIKENLVYLSSENNNINWVTQNLIIDPSITIVNVSEQKIDKNVYTLSNGSKITAYNVNNNEWYIENKDYLRYIYLDNGGYSLNVLYKDYTRQGINFEKTYFSSNPNVLTINEDGRILPISQGNATITVTAQGEQISLNITVKARANTFMLNLSAEDNRVGLKQERVWGYNFIVNSLDVNSFVNHYQLGYKENSPTYNGQVIENFSLLWEVDDTSLASVDDTGLVTFKQTVLGNKVEVKATELVHGIKTRLYKTYVFQFVNSSHSVNIFDFQKDYHYNIINELTQSNKMQVVLHTDIMVKSQITLGNSLYGNGHKIDATLWESGIRYHVPVIHILDSTIAPDLEELVLENFVLQGLDISGNTNIKLEDFKNRLTGIKINGVQNARPLIFKFLDIKYFHDAISFESSHNLTLEGSIVGDCFGGALNVIQQYAPEGAYINLANIVFKSTSSPSIMLSNGSIMPQGTEEHNDDAVHKARLARNYLPTITIDGFIDNYNWKKQNQLSSLLSLFQEDWFDDMDFISYDRFTSYIGGVLEELFKEPEYSHMIYKDNNGESWVSMMGFVTGIWSDVDIDNVNLENDNYSILEMQMPKRGIMGISLALVSQFLEIDVYNPCYIISYDFKDNAPAILPNQPCPNDEALLLRLQGNY